MIELPKIRLTHVALPHDAKPALYLMPEKLYHREPCPDAALSQSIAKIMLDQSPLHAWTAHPRLNPDFEEDDDKAFDIGNIAHKLMLGEGREIERLEFPDWRTDKAKIAREVLKASGILGVLGKHYDRAQRVVDTAKTQIRNLATSAKPFQTEDAHQVSELVAIWREDTIWLRTMMDSVLVTPLAIYVDDYKTTEMSASPRELDRMMVTMGWDIQAAFAERGLRAIDPSLDLVFRFVVQEAYEPFALSLYVMSESVMTMGRKKLDAAVHLWRTAMASGQWPGYSRHPVVGEYPPWAESSWLNRELTDPTLQETLR